MKKVIFSLVLALVSLGMSAQSVVKTEDGKYPVYCTVMGYNFWGLGKVKVELDFGDRTNSKSFQSLYDADGKKLKFNSMIEVLDYMGKRGWHVNGTYCIAKSANQNVIEYLLEKRVENDSQKAEGLLLKDDDSHKEAYKPGKNEDDLY